MTPELWLAVGTIVAAILGLGGVMYTTRSRPEPLSATVKAQADEIARLRQRVSDLENKLGTVAKLEQDKSRLLAIVSLLGTQVRAAGLTPIADVPADMAGLANQGNHG